MRTGIDFTVSDGDRQRLEAIVADRNSPQKHVWRARIVLLSADGRGTNAIMAATGTSKTTVWRWQARFMQVGVDGLLRDKTRPPGKAPVAEDRVGEVVRLTHGPPPHEATHWTAQAMARAAGLAVSTVQKIWKAHGLDRSVQEGLHAGVDLCAEPAHLALRDAGAAHRLDQVVDRSRRDAVHVGLLDHRRQRLLHQPAAGAGSRGSRCPCGASGCANPPPRPASPSPAPDSRCAAPAAPGSSRPRRRWSARPPPAPSAAWRQSRSSHAKGRHRGPSPPGSAGPSSSRSSGSLRFALAFASRPYRRKLDDHRAAARQRQRRVNGAGGRRRYPPATPLPGTRPSSPMMCGAIRSH